MWWLVTLLVLALVSFFVVKSMKARSQNSQAEHDSAQSERLGATSNKVPAVSAAAAAGVAANAGNNSAPVADTATSSHSASQAPSHSAASSASIQTNDELSDVREMIKILNLDGPDAGRLGVSKDKLIALRKGETTGIPDASELAAVAVKLRKMLA